MQEELPPQIDPHEKLLPTPHEQLETKKSGSTGTVISIVIIMTLLLAGGIYFFVSQLNKIKAQNHAAQTAAAAIYSS